MAAHSAKISSRFSAYFSDEARFYRVLLVCAGITAILKGLRLPYAWAATQAQIDYRYGFLRRGLFGEICRQLHLPIWRFGVFTALSFLLLICLLGLLAWCVRRSGLDAAGIGAFSALLAASFCLSSLVNTVGYFDVPMAILVLLVFLIRDARLQLAAVLLAGIVGVLVHEMYALTFLPVSLVGSVCWASELEGRRIRWSRWIRVGFAALAPWVLVFFLSHNAEMTIAQDEVLKSAIRSRVNFEPFDPMLNVLTFTSRDNQQIMMTYLRAGAWWVEEAFGLIAFLPTACFFLAIALRRAAGRSGVVKAWLVIATFSPLLLNIVAFDRFRWLTLMTLNAVLGSIAISYVNHRSPLRLDTSRAVVEATPLFSIAWRRAAVLLLAINLATDIGFFEDHAKSFPFRDYWKDYRDAVREQRPVLEPKELFPKRAKSQYSR